MWFRKEKSVKAPPRKCSRCGERVGVVHLSRVATKDVPGDALSLCEECARLLRNDPEDS
jgi:DNA-directed RNA polymerase subunit M/transcription elongation factor TFIIS